MATKHVVILSGGMDSVTLLYLVKSKKMEPDDELYALSFFYAQRHRAELDAAKATCARLSVPHKILNIDFLADLAPNSALTDLNTDVPLGHYADATMAKTVVPGRNTLFLSIGLAYAQGMLLRRDDGAMLYYGAHAGDHTIYPDCRLEFINSMADVIGAASEDRVQLDAPFRNIDKGDILKIGLGLGVDYRDTHTCYQNQRPPCGECGSCRERSEAFEQNGVVDPLTLL